MRVRLTGSRRHPYDRRKSISGKFESTPFRGEWQRPRTEEDGPEVQHDHLRAAREGEI